MVSFALEKGQPILELSGCKSIAGVDNLEIGCPFYTNKEVYCG